MPLPDSAPLPALTVSAPVLAHIQSIVRDDLKPVIPLPALWMCLFAAFVPAALVVGIHAALVGTSVSSLWRSLQPGARHALRAVLPLLLPAADTQQIRA